MKNKKSIITVVVIMVLLIGIIGKGISKQSDSISNNLLSEYNLRGDIESVIYKTTNVGYLMGSMEELNLEELTESDFHIAVNTFNKLGQITSLSTSNYEGYNESIIEYKYNNLNQLISVENPESVSHSEYSYNNSNQQIERRVVGETGERLSYSTMTYDDKGNNILMKNYSNDDEIRSLTENTFDDKGQMTDSIFTLYMEHPNGDPNVVVTIMRYVYDDKGNLLEDFTMSQNDDAGARRVRAYDEFNNQTHVTNYGEDDKILLDWRFKYVYDEKNNWIEKKTFSDNKIIQYIKREIVYR